MKEKLIDLLCQAHNLATDASAFGDATYAQQLEVEAEHLIAHGVTFAEDNSVPSKWISVKDRLPEKDKRVIAFKSGMDRSYIFLAKRFRDKWFDVEWNVYRYGVTHWMPLPPAPKGE